MISLDGLRLSLNSINSTAVPEGLCLCIGAEPQSDPVTLEITHHTYVCVGVRSETFVIKVPNSDQGRANFQAIAKALSSQPTVYLRPAGLVVKAYAFKDPRSGDVKSGVSVKATAVTLADPETVDF